MSDDCSEVSKEAITDQAMNATLQQHRKHDVMLFEPHSLLIFVYNLPHRKQEKVLSCPQLVLFNPIPLLSPLILKVVLVPSSLLPMFRVVGR